MYKAHTELVLFSLSLSWGGVFFFFHEAIRALNVIRTEQNKGRAQRKINQTVKRNRKEKIYIPTYT